MKVLIGSIFLAALAAPVYAQEPTSEAAAQELLQASSEGEFAFPSDGQINMPDVIFKRSEESKIAETRALFEAMLQYSIDHPRSLMEYGPYFIAAHPQTRGYFIVNADEQIIEAGHWYDSLEDNKYHFTVKHRGNSYPMEYIEGVRVLTTDRLLDHPMFDALDAMLKAPVYGLKGLPDGSQFEDWQVVTLPDGTRFDWHLSEVGEHIIVFNDDGFVAGYRPDQVMAALK